MPEIRIGIIGATGYTGSELVRILSHHPGVSIEVITSESREGDLFSDVHPFFRGICDKKLVPAADIGNFDLDLVFLALPHGVSMDFVRDHSNERFRIIDLSGDFRLRTPEVYEQWYNKEHSFPEGFGMAVFGLPELFFEQISKARLVANPGCYPTSAILGLAPALAGELALPSPLIVDSKSGTTGAGIKPGPVTHFSNVSDNFKAYGLKKHRHTIEIQDILAGFTDKELTVQFTPHLLPVDRGIFTTIYARPSGRITEVILRETYHNFYSKAPFIRMREEVPSIKDVRGSNYCDIFVTYDDRTDMILITSVIDNLVKGAAGQAVQNMNIISGWDETRGLEHIPLSP